MKVSDFLGLMRELYRWQRSAGGRKFSVETPISGALPVWYVRLENDSLGVSVDSDHTLLKEAVVTAFARYAAEVENRYGVDYCAGVNNG